MAVSAHTVNLGSTGWVGIAAASNGTIYAAPTTAGTFLKVNPTTEAFSKLGGFSTNYSWAGAFRAPSGYIYCVPHGSGSSGVLRINPSTDGASIVGSDAGSSGGEWWGGAMVGATIVAAPYASTSVLLFNTATETSSKLTGIPSGGAKWSGGAASNGGIVYCAPSRHGQVLRINPSAGTWSLIGSFGTTSNYKWINAVRGSDGRIYCGPVASDSVLCIDPTTDSTSLIPVPGHSSGGTSGWTMATLGTDGLLYMLPVLSGTVKTFNPTTGVFTTVASGIPGNFQFAVQVGDKLFASPHEGNYLLVIEGVVRRPRTSVGILVARAR